jgi:predicted RNA methylase
MTEQSTALATLANIDDLIEGRDRAIALWLKAREDFHATTGEAARICIGGALSFHVSTDRNGNGVIPEAFAATKEHREWLMGSKQRIESADDYYRRIVTEEIDRRCWTSLMDQLGFDQLLDRQAREEFRASLSGTPPEFNAANAAATFGNIWANRRDIYLRGVANVFMAMDRRFRSHDAFAIGNRLIIESALEEYGSFRNYNRRDTLADVERIFRELDGKGPVEPNQSIAQAVQLRMRDRPALIEGDYFRVRVFQNGNLHLWFTRKDLLKQVNELLLEYYKPVEGDVGQGPSYEAGPLYHATPAKHYGEFFTSETLADYVASKIEIHEGETVLEPSAGGGALAIQARRRGAIVTCVEVQPGLAHELATVRGFRQTHQRDFLTMTPAELGTFDKIIMNPPFDRGRDCDHVRHAWQFLRPGGTLAAIMSARAEFGTDARHKALHDIVASCNQRWSREAYWHDLPEKSFAHAGTNVNTVLLIMRKPRA